MALGAAGKIRLGEATKQGDPIFSKKANGIIYKDTDKVQPPMPTKRPIKGVSRQSGK
jgi:hypothetical protein